MQWAKKGVIFRPNGDYGWMNSHAQVPTILVKEDRLRIFFASRPQKSLSLTTFIDVDRENVSRILYINPHPILEPGRPGAFDAHGIMPSCIVQRDELVHLFYSGWCRCHDVPYRNYTGLAVSDDGGSTFARYSSDPILRRSEYEQYSATSPWVHVDGTWHMWYSSGKEWLAVAGGREHTYDLKHASSTDGCEWTENNPVAIPQGHRLEAITRPTILEIGGTYHMWFSYRGSRDFRGGAESYQIGYATSTDLEHWTRNDQGAGIHASDSGWDCNMIAYPAVVRVGKRIMMIYNGNDFGAGGFGYAELQSWP